MRPRRTDSRARGDRAALREAQTMVPVLHPVSMRVVGTSPLAQAVREEIAALEAARAVQDVAHVRDAVQKIHGAAAREAAATKPQTDLEEHAGVAEDQQAREAEAGGIASDRLRSVVERIERLEEERKALAKDVRDIYSEAKSAGFEPKVLRRLIRERKREPADVEEEETLLDLYKRALGM
jgi:uncharacterized protein (UPF0335 family)